VLALARAADASPNLRFAGIQCYLGHLQHIGDREARRAADEAAFAILQGVIADLTAAGLPPSVVTGGGTGSHAYDLASGVYTELQAGSYAVMDVEYGACDAPERGDWPFEPAMAVAATVVSNRHKSHVDATARRLRLGSAPRRRSAPKERPDETLELLLATALIAASHAGSRGWTRPRSTPPSCRPTSRCCRPTNSRAAARPRPARPRPSATSSTR
jgi:hypothetical protein